MVDLIEIEGSKIKIDRIDNIIRLKEIFPEFESLCGRDSGLLIRQIIEKKTENIDSNVITIDFEGIESITQGFADEIIGVLIKDKGIEFIKSRIKVVNANDFIRGILNWVVSYRLKA